MRILGRCLLLLPLLLAGCQTAVGPRSSFPAATTARFDEAIEQAIAEGRLPGGVLHVERGNTVYERAYGRRAVEPVAEAMTADTIFDIASLTKVIATTPAVMKLVEQKKIGLDEPVSRYLPEFRGGWRDDVTVRHLLTHVSGLRADVDLDTPWSGYETGIELALAEEPRNRPGAVFLYSDINFALLGEIVRRVSGEPLDRFARRTIFEPLEMNETRFNPREDDRPRIAPTERTQDDGLLRGIVHDPTARRMGGVAGHAGVFAPMHDLVRFVRMILHEGTLDGVRVLAPETVRLMTSVQTPPGVAVRRGLGWDIDSTFSRQRGNFPVGSFGHTGYTGTSIWIDPASKTFYLFLSNRVHPDGRGNINMLRETLGHLVSEAAGYTEFPEDVRIDPKSGAGSVLNGIDVLAARRYDSLRGMRVGLITNQTGRDRFGNPTIDLLRSAPGVELVALFSPEHGIRGTADENVADDADPVTGLPIHSLYGERRAPSPEQLAGLDALVFDIQDIGTRFYTYTSTMGLAMEAAAKAGVRFVVLDRINPVNGIAVEGPVEIDETGFTAFHPIAIRHGMTIGELAGMFREERKIPVDLRVIAMRGWSRSMWQDETGLPWFNTSPNIRNLRAATLYPGIGMLETMALSVGRGTPTPFEILGAPYIDGEALALELDQAGLTSCARFEPVSFTPDASVFSGEKCGGVRIVMNDRNECNVLDIGITIARALQQRYPESLELAKMNRLVRHAATIDALARGHSVGDIRSTWTTELESFRKRRARFLLYP